MKIVNLKNMQKTLCFFVFYLSISFVFTNSMSFGLLKKTHRNKNEENKEKSKNYIQYKEALNKAVYFEGWIKYLHYSDRDKDKSKAFFKNTNFAKQERNQHSRNNHKNDKVNLNLEMIFLLNF